jgi:nicotinate-nucleotide adenylyltransferase
LRSLGLFCGTFNPIHVGHLLIGECACDQFKLDKVLFVTSATPPHRRTGLLAAEHRYEMVKAAVEDNPRFEASRLELDRDGPSYTADTVTQMLEQYGEETRIFLILGGDNVRTIKDWNKAEILMKYCCFLVAPRMVYERTLVAKPTNQREGEFLETVKEQSSSTRYDITGARVSIIDFPPVSISSSMVRKRLKENRSVLYMVPKPVNDILMECGYYAKEFPQDG